jgi:hypothetical protein
MARALIDAGVVDGLEEAFDRFLGRGRPAFVEKELPPLRDVANLVHAGCGLVLAAHMGERGHEDQLRAFREDGLDGIEVRHPSHSPRLEKRLTKLARQLDLVISGGSDWHGESSTGISHAPLGGMQVPLEWLEALECRKAKAYG